MSIADVRRAVNEGLAGTGTCTSVEMSYLEGGKKQLFRFKVALNGQTHVVEEEVPASADPNVALREAAQAFVASLEG